MKIESVKISKVKPNPENPRVIKDDKFRKLVKSIKEFPDMLRIRPIVVNNEMIVLGGNMRLRACKEAGLTDIYIIQASELTEEQQKEFVIKDNSSFGEWDWDVLANEWEAKDLGEWGIDVPRVDYEPLLAPDIDTSEVTRAEIEQKAMELAKQMISQQQTTDVICPNCANEFSI
jgi:ParB-like chromosome segregation protein Spo0J